MKNHRIWRLCQFQPSFQQIQDESMVDRNRVKPQALASRSSCSGKTFLALETWSLLQGHTKKGMIWVRLPLSNSGKWSFRSEPTTKLVTFRVFTVTGRATPQRYDRLPLGWTLGGDTFIQLYILYLLNLAINQWTMMPTTGFWDGNFPWKLANKRWKSSEVFLPSSFAPSWGLKRFGMCGIH